MMHGDFNDMLQVSLAISTAQCQWQMHLEGHLYRCGVYLKGFEKKVKAPRFECFQESRAILKTIQPFSL